MVQFYTILQLEIVGVFLSPRTSDMISCSPELGGRPSHWKLHNHWLPWLENSVRRKNEPASGASESVASWKQTWRFWGPTSCVYISYIYTCVCGCFSLSPLTDVRQTFATSPYPVAKQLPASFRKHCCPSFLHINFADSSERQLLTTTRRPVPSDVVAVNKVSDIIWVFQKGWATCKQQMVEINGNTTNTVWNTPGTARKHKHNECRVSFPEWNFIAPSNWNPATSCWMVGLDWYPTWPARPCKHVKTHDDRWQLHLI